MKPPRVALLGVSGYSRVHLTHLWSMDEAGEIVLAAVVVIDADRETAVCERLRSMQCEVLPDLESLLRAVPRLLLDLCIVPTPIHLHCPQTVALLAAGVNVLVEKPLAPTVRDADAMIAATRQSGGVTAVGFQYLHAPEVQGLKTRLLAGDIGVVRRISVCASWPRGLAYYRRNVWAGRIRIADAWVLDSPVANAMAHFFLLLLYLAGETPRNAARITRINAELYRVQEIESFDTAVISMMCANGCVLDFYGTHSAREMTRPIVLVEGRQGRAEWVQDSHALVEGPAVSWRQAAAAESDNRERMLRDVLARCAGEDRFICTPELALEHVRCVDALNAHAPISSIAAEWKSTRQENDETFTYVPGLNEHLATAFARRTGLRAAGAPWALAATVFDVAADAGSDALTT